MSSLQHEFYGYTLPRLEFGSSVRSANEDLGGSISDTESSRLDPSCYAYQEGRLFGNGRVVLVVDGNQEGLLSDQIMVAWNWRGDRTCLIIKPPRSYPMRSRDGA
jgi:hypothetical protein